MADEEVKKQIGPINPLREDFNNGKQLAVASAMATAIFIALYSTLRGQAVPEGVSGILSALNSLAFAVYGGSEALRIWKGDK